MYNNQFNYNPYMNQQPRYVPMEQPMVQSNMLSKPILNGKIVESIEVVKAIDIPFDGSISYFPTADGTTIITKQLQTDGTSKMVVYKPIENSKEEIKYLTKEDLDDFISDLDLEEIRDDLSNLKQELKEMKKKKSE